MPNAKQPQEPDDITLLEIYRKANGGYEIKYDYEKDGPDHAAVWVCVYRMGEVEIGRGGPTTDKQKTKRQAAKKALGELRKRGL